MPILLEVKFSVAEVEASDDALVAERTGAVPSITISFAPAMLFAPVGNVVAVIAFPAISSTVPVVNAVAVKSAEVSPA